MQIHLFNKTVLLSWWLVILVSVFLWVGVHLPPIFYGTDNTPLHVSYWSADEQSPINGALHMLQEKSLLGLRNENTIYYGPVLSVFALPAAVADFLTTLVTGQVTGPESYKDHIVFDWGGILMWARVIASLVGFAGLVAVFLLFRTKTINPSQVVWVPYMATGTLAVSHLYFEYASFFRHWVFIVTFLLWQIYLAVRIIEVSGTSKRLWVGQGILTVASFGISYLSLIYQVFWIPVLYRWMRSRDWLRLKAFGWYVLSSCIGAALVIWWHPYAFVRILGLVGLIDPIAIGPALDLAVRAEKQTSFYFYAHVIFFEILPLLALVGVLSKFLKKRLFDGGHGLLLWMLLIPAGVNYLIFGNAPLHVVRYMSPTVVLLIVVSCVLLSHAVNVLGTRHLAIRLSTTIVGVFMLLNTVQLIGWERMIHAGPSERRTIIPRIQAWQAQDPGAKTLLVKNWPLGYVHTHAAYTDYVDRSNKASYDLWQYILTLDPPATVAPINVYYRRQPYTVTEEDRVAFDHIVVHSPPAISTGVWHESPEDEYDYWPWHVWKYERYQEKYEVLK